MALTLTPETENRVCETAAREGVSIDELLNRFLSPPLPAASLLVPTAKPAGEETREETRVRVQGLLNKWRDETGMLPGENKSLAQLFAEWTAEDAHLTPEQVEEEHIFWEEYKKERGKWPVEI